MIKIGVINIDTSHPKTFSQNLLKNKRAKYYAVYNDGFRGDDEVGGFIKNSGLFKRCNSIEELAQITDIGFVQSCNWDRHLKLAKPFIDIGKPVFIDKPIVGNMNDCREVERLADEGKVILGSSSVRYAEEIVSLKSKLNADNAQILTVYGTAGVDEFNYGVHIAEGIDGLINDEAVSCKYVGTGKSDDIKAESFCVNYKNGANAVFTICHGKWAPFNMVVMTTQGNYSFEIDTGRIYNALLDRICDYMESGVNKLATVKELTNSIKIMLAGKVSRENNGEEIKIKDIPKDYKGFDGDKFEKEYAGASAKIYL